MMNATKLHIIATHDINFSIFVLIYYDSKVSATWLWRPLVLDNGNSVSLKIN